MIDLDDVYFEWLLNCIDPEGVTEGVAYVCSLLHRCEFHRRVGNDINRAMDGANLRKEFIYQFSEADFNSNDVDDLLAKECSWLEMLIALARGLDFIYDGGVDGRFIELITNMNLGHMAIYDPSRSLILQEYDQHTVDVITSNFDNNRFSANGHGGMFPLRKPDHPDQREVEIWDQHAAYFRERLEGVLWTSTK